jgi:DNA-binding transcriptional MerR regulator
MLKSAYSIGEVADFFQVSTRTIRVWLEKDDSFPRPFKKFGTLRFNRFEIERYWTENTLREEQ